MHHHIRIARPTNDFDSIIKFYTTGLGFDILGRFYDHDGFSGIMLGHTGAGYHLEFTSKKGECAGEVPSEDNLLVLYIPDKAEWQAKVDRMQTGGFEPVPSFNPYWDANGLTFEDCDGYRIVLQNAAWPAK